MRSDIRKILSQYSLSDEERRVLEYFIKNISVGEIIAEKELKLFGVDDPLKVIRNLIEKNLIEHGEGCFNLSKEIRKIVLS